MKNVLVVLFAVVGFVTATAHAERWVTTKVAEATAIAFAYDDATHAWVRLDTMGRVGWLLPTAERTAVAPLPESVRHVESIAAADGAIFASTSDGVYRHRSDEGWRKIDDSRETKRIVARSGSLLVATEHTVRASADGGATFTTLPGVERDDTIVALDSVESTVLVGTQHGDLIEVANSEASRTHLCTEPVSALTHAVDGPRVFAGCGSSVLARDDQTTAWRPLARNVAGTILSLAPNPFQEGTVFVGTREGTFYVTPHEAAVRVGGPSESLRLVDLPTHSVIAGLFSGRVVALATPTCAVQIYNYPTLAPPSPGYYTDFYPSWYRISTRTSTPSCTWTFDLKTLPPWLHFHLVSGQFNKGSNIIITGPATIDLSTDRNTGYLRSAVYAINGPGYQLRSFLSQLNRINLCMHKPVSKDLTSGTFYDEGEFLVLIRRWGDAKAQAPRVIFQVADSSGCPADGLLRAATPGFVHSTISMTGVYQKGQPIVISAPFVPQNLTGEAAVFDLRGGGGSIAPSAVATLLLPPLGALPPDLQITGQTMNQTVLAFGSTGGQITIPSSVTRSRSDPNRRCAFASSLYQAVGGTWLTVSQESGCPGASPDAGNIVITAKANHNTTETRLGVVYTAWGWAAVVVQPSD